MHSTMWLTQNNDVQYKSQTHPSPKIYNDGSFYFCETIRDSN